MITIVSCNGLALLHGIPDACNTDSRIFSPSVSDIPISRTALKHRRLMALTFFAVSHLKRCNLRHKLKFLRPPHFYMNGFEKVSTLQARHYGRKMYKAKIRKQNK